MLQASTVMNTRTAPTDTIAILCFPRLSHVSCQAFNYNFLRKRQFGNIPGSTLVMPIWLETYSVIQRCWNSWVHSIADFQDQTP